jgi:pSer/pThr/pTyr-binding forkhead associated (FHA) protein
MPKLILMKGSAATKQVALRPSETTIGRGSTNDVVLDSMQVSRRHAVITINGPFVTITDLGSRNGLFVNGARASSQVLVGGDEISIGSFRLRFLASEHHFSTDALRLMTTPELLAEFERARETSPARV